MADLVPGHCHRDISLPGLQSGRSPLLNQYGRSGAWGLSSSPDVTLILSSSSPAGCSALSSPCLLLLHGWRGAEGETSLPHPQVPRWGGSGLAGCALSSAKHTGIAGSPKVRVGLFSVPEQRRVGGVWRPWEVMSASRRPQGGAGCGSEEPQAREVVCLGRAGLSRRPRLLVSAAASGSPELLRQRSSSHLGCSAPCLQPQCRANLGC